MLAMQNVLLNVANGDNFQGDITQLAASCFKDDVNLSDLSGHLPILQDVIKKCTPAVKMVTSVQTSCEAMNTCKVYQDMLHAVHKLLRLYLTVPLTSATSVRTFSALRRILTYVRSSMTEQRLNNWPLLHIQKDLTDSLDLISVAKEFIDRYDDRKKYFGKFH